MMLELSLNILDIVENSVAANATLITITVIEDINNDLLSVSIEDNGKGMDSELLKNAADPFITTRKTRRIGLGLPFFKMAAELAGGNFSINSEKGKGTAVFAAFKHSHIDRMPLGDMAGTLSALITANPKADFLYTHTYNDKSFSLDTRELKKILKGVSLSRPEISLWISDYVRENLNNIYGG